MNIQQIFEKYYQPGTPLYNSVWSHSKLVAEKALKLAQAHPELNIDSDFVYEAAIQDVRSIYKSIKNNIFRSIYGTIKSVFAVNWVLVMQ